MFLITAVGVACQIYSMVVSNDEVIKFKLQAYFFGNINRKVSWNLSENKFAEESL